MNDTRPEMAERYRQMLLARSGEERLKMGSSMSATARALVRASVLARDPQASQVAIRRELFLRFYGHEFDAEARERIPGAAQRGLSTVPVNGRPGNVAPMNPGDGTS